MSGNAMIAAATTSLRPSDASLNNASPEFCFLSVQNAVLVQIETGLEQCLFRQVKFSSINEAYVCCYHPRTGCC